MSDRAELEGSWPQDAPWGTVVMTRLRSGGIRIDHADPRIVISAELLASIKIFSGYATLELVPGGTFRGAILRVEGVNRKLVYRITEYLPAVHGYVAEWPD